MSLTSLTESAEQCIDHLQQQITSAQNLRSSHHVLNRLVLISSISELQSHTQSLSQWKARIGTVQEGPDKKSYNKSVEAATEFLTLIGVRTATIEDALRRGQGSKVLSDKDRLASRLVLNVSD
jgi:hypothetical protein